MSWTAFHSRGETLQAVVDAANARHDGVLPMQVPGVAENFTDEIDLAGALLLKWHARLSGNIERALMREPMDLEAAVASAWQTTAEQMPGVRLVVDRCTQWPQTDEMASAMEHARELEWIRLATAAGLANDQGPHAAEVGRRVEELAREGLARGTESPVLAEAPAGDTPTAESVHDDDTPSESFVDRIKAALAA
jgi:predicted TIM-barrel fold metal-dependent hydrolase